MMTKRMTLGYVGVLMLAGAAFGQVKAVIELVADKPSPYVGGESSTVDVRVQAQDSTNLLLAVIQLDFSDSDPAHPTGNPLRDVTLVCLPARAWRVCMDRLEPNRGQGGGGRDERYQWSLPIRHDGGDFHGFFVGCACPRTGPGFSGNDPPSPPP